MRTSIALLFAASILCSPLTTSTLAQAPLLPSHDFRVGDDAPVIEIVRDIAAPPSEVWRVWTTTQGFADAIGAHLECELRPGGKYEIHWAPDAPPGSRGSEGCAVLSFVPEQSLSFTWNAPPNFPTLRDERTWVVVDLRALPNERTRMTITHLGFGEGEEWDALREYFTVAWTSVSTKIQRELAPANPPDVDPRNGWVYLLRLTRPDIFETATEAELAAFRGHSDYLRDLTHRGVVIVAGPVTDDLALGIVVFEAPNEPAARDIMLGDPGVAGGVFTAELHPMRLSLVRDRDTPKR